MSAGAAAAIRDLIGITIHKSHQNCTNEYVHVLKQADPDLTRLAATAAYYCCRFKRRFAGLDSLSTIDTMSSLAAAKAKAAGQ